MRIKIIILSTVLITLISGVLYYKNLTQFSVGEITSKLNIDELRTIDLQIASTAFYLRQNLNSDFSDLQTKKLKINELQKLLNTINKTSPELLPSVTKIRAHLENKLKVINDFELSIVRLKESVNALLPLYTEMEKKNIKFILEKRDFYRECLLHIYMFISFPNKDSEIRILEDQKILGQILNFSTSPSPEIQKFSTHIQVIQNNIKEINSNLTMLKEDTIENEVKIIEKYYQSNSQEQVLQNENLLNFMIAAVALYLIFMILLLRKI